MNSESSPLDSEEPLTSAQVDLAYAGEGNEFHTRNASPQDWERRNVIERTEDSVQVYCDLMDVRHGTLDQDSGDAGSLLVFRFRFNPSKESRRVHRARLEIEFLPATKGGSTPEVEAIAPEERWSLLPQVDKEELVKGGELKLGASGVPFLDAGATVKMEKTTSRDIQSATTVTGARNLGTGKDSGSYTRAVWTLLENNSRESGVPDSLSVAVLLRRDDDMPFNASVKLEAHADFVTSVGRFFRKVPLDEPILFNPTAQPKRPNKGRAIQVENLTGVDLYSLCHARMSSKAFWADESAK